MELTGSVVGYLMIIIQRNLKLHLHHNARLINMDALMLHPMLFVYQSQKLAFFLKDPMLFFIVFNMKKKSKTNPQAQLLEIAIQS